MELLFSALAVLVCSVAMGLMMFKKLFKMMRGHNNEPTSRAQSGDRSEVDALGAESAALKAQRSDPTQRPRE